MLAACVTHTIAEGGDRQPVANRRLAAVTLILLLAFTLCSAFVYCHSKLVRLCGFSALEVASQLRRSISKLPPQRRRSGLIRKPCPLPSRDAPIEQPKRHLPVPAAPWCLLRICSTRWSATK
jgi:hypothetical protein